MILIQKASILFPLLSVPRSFFACLFLVSLRCTQMHTQILYFFFLSSIYDSPFHLLFSWLRHSMPIFLTFISHTLRSCLRMRESLRTSHCVYSLKPSGTHFFNDVLNWSRRRMNSSAERNNVTVPGLQKKSSIQCSIAKARPTRKPISMDACHRVILSKRVSMVPCWSSEFNLHSPYCSFVLD